MSATYIVTSSLSLPLPTCLSYCRGRSSPWTKMCSPFFSFCANLVRLPHATTRCQSVSRLYSWDSLSFHERPVATERTTKSRLLFVVLSSASLPRNPMRLTWFKYIVSAPFLRFSACAVHTCPRGCRARLPRKALECFCWKETHTCFGEGVQHPKSLKTEERACVRGAAV